MNNDPKPEAGAQVPASATPAPASVAPSSPDDLQKALEAERKRAQELTDELAKLKGARSDAEAKSAETEKLRKKLGDLAKELGIDLGTDDPEKIRERREAVQRAREQRASRIEKAVLLALASKGKAIDPEVVEMVTMRAVANDAISFDEATGTVKGVPEFLDKVLQHFGGTVSPMPAPAKPLGGQAATSDPTAADVKSYADLVGRGQTFMNDFRSKYPDRFRQLQAEHRSMLRNPTGLRTSTPNDPQVVRIR